MRSIWQDVRHGGRLLIKNPGFSFIIVLSIAIGVGANATMFSVADTVLLRPLPVPRPHDVVSVSSTTPSNVFKDYSLSYPDYEDVRAASRSFTGLVAQRIVFASLSAAADQPAARTVGMAVSANLFSVMEIRPAIGRFFLPGEDQVTGRDAVIVLDHGTWTRTFDADPSIAGRQVRLANRDFTVVGVAPKSFSGLDAFVHPAFYVPVAMLPAVQARDADALTRRDMRIFNVKARLRPGIQIAQAREDANRIGVVLSRDHQDTNRNQGLTVRTEIEMRQVENTLGWIGMLVVLSAAVLLVACANVAGLLTSRAPARAKELALRLAVGAGRRRLIRQLVTESLMLATLGGLAGLAIGYAGILLFQRIDLGDVPLKVSFELNRRAMAIGMALAAVSALVSSLAPAAQATRLDLVTAIKSGVASARPSRRWGRHVLVCSQVGLSLLLLTVAVAIFRSFQVQLGQGPGFRTDHVLMMSFDPALAGYDTNRTATFFDTLKERAAAIPGVRSTALTTVVPMNGAETAAVIPEGYAVPAGTDALTIGAAHVDEGYFDTLGIAIRQGRGFGDADTASAPRVAVVNETMAARRWPGQSAVGKRFRLRGEDAWIAVVGVAATTKYVGTSEAPTEFLYLPWRQQAVAQGSLLVHTAGDPIASVAPLRDAVRAAGSEVPIFNTRSMENFYEARSVGPHRLLLQMVGSMGVMGLVLALVGLYGLVAHAASRRTREIGIRMAVGATPTSVLMMVLRHGLWLTAAGLVLGTAGSSAVSGLLNAAFPSVPGIGAAVYGMVVPVIVAVTLLAAYVPARRAAGIDPIRAIRAD